MNIKTISRAMPFALAATALFAPTSAYAGLDGSTMGWQYYAYGGAYNSQTNFVVGPGVEGNFAGYFDIDVDDTSITFDYMATSTWSTSSLSLSPTIYNGIAMRMVSGPAFSSVTIDASTNMVGFNSSRVSFTGSEIQVDWMDLSFTPDTIVKLNVNAVPEPTSMAALALGSVAFLRRRRK
ncbi:MAG: hypothetical protein AMXMBFR19_23980 [Chthonomonadaceae bacterium]|uniref:Ice-binding protein C-terminal domain-containing protein n=1 Tax=Candidatus Nitrosymbiomonas proteolyticus TaxID=2608984 RepID=A0A809RE03_9BACT|nr:conserved hypothetical protein [Candidatus Nitrosymbiomonas proteolyticus]HQU18066.1 PEP-CTERM sorting domain-containing protein [Fimbriimonadaceae bacterium]